MERSKDLPGKGEYMRQRRAVLTDLYQQREQILQRYIRQN